MPIKLSLALSESNVSQANNTSVVTAVLKAVSNYGSYDHNNPPGYITIDGTKYTFNHSCDANKTTTLATKSKTVTHNADGSKTVSVSASYTTKTSSGTVTTSGSITLTKITRTFTVKYNANGGTGAPGNQTKTYGQTLTLSGTRPTREGYAFQGWATSATGAVAYQPGGAYTANAAVTLYAIWKLMTYTVSYNANGGTGQPDNQTKTHGQTLTLSQTAPTRGGYVFYHWNTAANNSGTTYAPGAEYTGNAALTLYAIWNPVITYNANGGTGQPGNQTKTYGQTLTLSETRPTREGYSFQGWATSASGSVAYQPGGAYTSNDAVTLYAIWKLITYAVTYNANGGTGQPGNQTKSYGQTLKLSETQPTRGGYVFYHWNTAANNSGTTYAPGADYTGNAALTLYAIWNPVITYNANGGTGQPGNQTKTYGQTLTLSQTAPTRTGYIFQGWATSASGSVAYQPGGAYTSNDAVTLYAIWKLITYAVTYNANGGTGQPGNQTKSYGQTLKLSGTQPTRGGYVFYHWNTAANNSGTTYAPGADYTGNAALTLYAIWNPVITYNANGGTGAPANQTKTYGTAITLQTGKPTRAGYAFNNWNTAANGGGTAYTPGQSYSAENALTLYAQWKSLPATPTVSISKAIRTNQAGAQDDVGKYGQVTVVWKVDQTSQAMGTGNLGTVTLAVDVEGVTQTVSGPNKDAAGGTAVFTLSGLDTEKQYKVTATVKDKNNGQASASNIITKAFFTMDFASGGKGVGIGEAAPSSGLSIGFDTNINKPLKVGDGVTGKITLSGAEAHIAYASGVQTRNDISFYAGDKDGSGLVIGAAGRTIIGSGESAQNLRTALGTGKDTDESMHVASDYAVQVHTNCQTIANRKTFTFGTDGTLDSPAGYKKNGAALAASDVGAYSKSEIDTKLKTWSNSAIDSTIDFQGTGEECEAWLETVAEGMPNRTVYRRFFWIKNEPKTLPTGLYYLEGFINVMLEDNKRQRQIIFPCGGKAGDFYWHDQGDGGWSAITAFTAQALVTQKIDEGALDSTAGSKVFRYVSSSNNNDHVNLQADCGDEKFQIEPIYNSIRVRMNDKGSADSENWNGWSTLYGTLNKPSAADVGAYSKSESDGKYALKSDISSIPTIYSGEGMPSSEKGEDGDLYIQYVL